LGLWGAANAPSVLNKNMGNDQVRTWEEANQICLMAALAEVRASIEKLLARSETRNTAEAPAAGTNVEDIRATMAAPPALDTLCATFGLTSFERRILLMCAGVELDARFGGLYAAANPEVRSTLPTFSLALAAFADAHWSALLPTQPLRFWRMIEVSPGESLTTSPLRIDERILHYLAGMPSFDERLRSLTEPVASIFGGRSGGQGPPPDDGDGQRPPLQSELSASQRALAELIAARWPQANLRPDGSRSRWPVVQLCGSDGVSRRAVAANASAALGLRLSVMPAHAVPRAVAELDLFIRIWEREAALAPSALLLEYDDTENSDSQAESGLKRMVETLRSPLLISAPERHRPVRRRLLSFDVPATTSTEQLNIWKEALGASAAVLNGKVETLVSQFTLSSIDIHSAASQALQLYARAPGVEPAAGSVGQDSLGKDAANQLAAALWDACRRQVRPRLEGLARRLEPCASWDDLVLPAAQERLLHQIALHVRQRSKVYQTWGFASKGSRGLGISALFAGPSGTGKTMAGEVLANELQLDLYRIDLSQVVSKYIGETEKNLRRVFDAAEGGAAILLFDEADALFGKRSEVKDSHDRYANIEVGYLLQRMEAYRGLAILTTNRKEALDTAFLRRIRFVVEFPFPESAQRMEIWRRVFPRATPTEGLRIDRLARLGAAGGNIYNIAMGAAFLAADAGEPVRMSHLLSAARNEFTKIERPLTDAETAGWV